MGMLIFRKRNGKYHLKQKNNTEKTLKQGETATGGQYLSIF